MTNLSASVELFSQDTGVAKDCFDPCFEALDTYPRRFKRVPVFSRADVKDLILVNAVESLIYEKTED